MRRGWKRLGIVVVGLLCLAVAAPSSFAQFGSPAGNGPPPGAGGPPPDPFSMKDDGAPNAFSDFMGLRATEPLLPPRIGSLLPGILFRRPTLATPAEFPNPGSPSSDEASPFTVQDGGWGNGFSERADPYPPGILGRLLGVQRLLYTELLDPPRSKTNPHHIITFRAEALNWRLQGGPVSVPLVTTDPNPTLATFGQLDSPSTQILVSTGNGAIPYPRSIMWRLTGAVATPFFPPVEISGFWYNHTTTFFSEGSTTSPARLLAIPFQDIQPAFIIPGTDIGIETAAVIAVPLNSGIGGQAGAITITSQASFGGLEANVFLPLIDTDHVTTEIILGYRYLYLNETLAINTSSGDPGSVFWNTFLMPQGFVSTTTDSFSTTNRFDGFQPGFRSVINMRRFALFSDLKFAFGQTTSRQTNSGISSLIQTPAGRPVETLNGGILALGSNGGTISKNYFSIAPEINLGVSYQITSNLRVFGGYSLLYWSTVARPGDYITNLIDSRQIPTAANFAPGANFNGPTRVSAIIPRDITVQGLYVGIEIGF